MKIVLIIYIVSWLILLAFYLYKREPGDNALKDLDGSEKAALVLGILLAPLAILIVPFYLVSVIKEKRETAEWKRKEQEENEYRQKALAAMRQAKSLRDKDKSSFFDFHAFITSLRSMLSKDLYVQVQKEENYPSIMKYLPDLSLPQRASLHVEKCRMEGSGDESKLFVEAPEGAYDLSIWDYITVKDNEEGAWSAYLLYNLWHVLPLFWHANYNRRFYLFDPEYIDFIQPMNKEDGESLRAAMKPRYTYPDVIKADGKYYVSCCYFSNFGGLIQETIEITINNGNASFHEIEKNTLLKYDCGVRF